MNATKALFVCALPLLTATGLTACGRQIGDPSDAGRAAAAGSATSVRRLKIVNWGPRKTKAGVPFNVQPGGAAALWIRMNQSLDGSRAWIQFADATMQGHVSGNLVTAAVPPVLYVKPGIYAIRVVVRKGDATHHSNEVRFTVE